MYLWASPSMRIFLNLSTSHGMRKLWQKVMNAGPWKETSPDLDSNALFRAVMSLYPMKGLGLSLIRPQSRYSSRSLLL